MYANDPYEPKYQYLINKREGVGINHFEDPKAFIEYSNDMHDVYKKIDDYNSNHHSAEISVIWLVERSSIKLLILHVTREK